MPNKVVSLNRGLNEFLAVSEEDRRIKAKDRMVRALRLCENDAETMHVIRSVSEGVIASIQKSSTPGRDAWSTLNVLISCLDLTPAMRNEDLLRMELAKKVAKKVAKPIDQADSDGEGVSKIWHLIDESIQGMGRQKERNLDQGLDYVPAGHSDLFEQLKEAGIKHDFQRELDDHLKRVIPLYLSKEPKKAPATTQEAFSTARLFVHALLDEVVNSHCLATQEELVRRCVVEELLEEGSIESGDTVSIIGAYILAVVEANKLIFDLLYASEHDLVTAHNSYISRVRLNPVLRRSMENLAAAINAGSSDLANSRKLDLGQIFQVSSGDWAKLVANELESWFVKTVAGCVANAIPGGDGGGANELLFALASRPGLLIPALRNDVLDEISDYVELHEWICGPFHEFYRYDGSQKSLGARISNCLISVAVSGMSESEFGEDVVHGLSVDRSVMDLVGLGVIAPSIDEIYSSAVRIGWRWHHSSQNEPFSDGSNVGDDLLDNEDYREFRKIVYERLRNCIYSGERLQVEFDQLKGDWMSHDIDEDGTLQYPEKPILPAILSISSYINRTEHIPSDFVLAFNSCKIDGLDVLASRLLNHSLVIYDVQRSNEASGNDRVRSEGAKLLDDISKAVRYLDGRVPLSATREALEVAIQLYKIRNQLEEDDYFSEGLSELIGWIDERRPGLIPLVDQSRNILPSYESRILRLSAGNSGRWPASVRKHVMSVEAEHDFNIGNKGDTTSDNDYPWVVSYHKIIESMLRDKLQFLFEDPLIELVRRANHPEKVRYFEPFKVLRFMERAESKPKDYSEAVDELARRGVRLKEAKYLMREYMDIAKLRNIQAHRTGSLHEAERLRMWVLKNLHSVLEVFSIE